MAHNIHTPTFIKAKSLNFLCFCVKLKNVSRREYLFEIFPRIKEITKVFVFKYVEYIETSTCIKFEK